MKLLTKIRAAFSCKRQCSGSNLVPFTDEDEQQIHRLTDYVTALHERVSNLELLAGIKEN